MIIRKAKKADLSEIRRLNKALFDFEEKFGHSYNLNWPYEEDGLNYFEKRLNNKNSLVFVAEEKYKIVGYIISFIDTYPYRRTNPICEIENMFVEEEFRKNGIGGKLIAKVRNEAKKRNVKKLRVGAIAQNENAINFYRSQGFTDVNLYLEENL